MRTARVRMKLTIRVGEGDLQSGQQGRVEYGESSASVHVEPSLTHLWCQMLEFCRSVNPNLDNYEADGVRSRPKTYPSFLC